MALADDSSPVFVARAMNAFGSMFIDMREGRRRRFPATADLAGATITPASSRAPSGSSAPATAPTFRTMDSCTRWCGSQAAFRRRASLTSAAATGLRRSCWRRRIRKRRSGVSTSTRPRSRPLVPAPTEAGVANRTTFEVADAKSYSGAFDLICFFDCLHDMGDPVGAARYARRAPRSRRHRLARRTVRARRPCDEHDRQSDGRAALHRVGFDLYAEFALAGGRARPRRAGRRSTAACRCSNRLASAASAG